MLIGSNILDPIAEFAFFENWTLEKKMHIKNFITRKYRQDILLILT